MPLEQAIPKPETRPDGAPGAFLTGPDAAREPSRPFGRFFGWLFVLPVLLYLTAFPLVRTPAYERFGPSHWGPILDFAYNTQGEDADVVIFGDSSAFLGIDPRLVDRQLGIKTVVLPSTVGSLPVTGDSSLAFYLAHNAKPRLIVLYFTAWDLDYRASRETHLYEGEEMLLRHGSARQIADFTLKHPLEVLAFPLRDYSSLGPGVLKPILHGEDRTLPTRLSRGHADDHENYPPDAAGCSIPGNDVDEQSTATARALVAKYRSLGYTVAVYLAPMPGCTGSAAFADQTYGGLALAPPAILPPGDFLDDGLYAHAEPAAVPAVSRRFADTIAPLLGKPAQ